MKGPTELDRRFAGRMSHLLASKGVSRTPQEVHDMGPGMELWQLLIQLEGSDTNTRPLRMEAPRRGGYEVMWLSLRADMLEIVEKGGGMWGCAKWVLPLMALIETQVSEDR